MLLEVCLELFTDKLKDKNHSEPNYISEAANALNTIFHKFLVPGARNMLRLRSKWNQGGLSLLELFYTTCGYRDAKSCWETSEPKDKVYALLGMIGSTSEKKIVPDYKKPCNQIYTEAATELIKTSDGALILSLCRFPHVQEQLPSWVPDWSAACESRAAHKSRKRWDAPLTSRVQLNGTKSFAEIGRAHV